MAARLGSALVAAVPERVSRRSGYRFAGESFDCGSKIGFLAATVAYPLARQDIAPEFPTQLKRLVKDL